MKRIILVITNLLVLIVIIDPLANTIIPVAIWPLQARYLISLL